MKKVYRLGLLTALMGIFVLAGSSPLRAQYTIQTNYENGGFVNPGTTEYKKEVSGIPTTCYGRYNYTGGSDDLQIWLDPSVNLPTGSVSVKYYADEGAEEDSKLTAPVTISGNKASVAMEDLIHYNGSASSKTYDGKTCYKMSGTKIGGFKWNDGDWTYLFAAGDTYLFDISITIDGVTYTATWTLNICYDPGYVAAPTNVRIQKDYTRVTFMWDEPQNSGWHSLGDGVELSFPFYYHETGTGMMGEPSERSLALSEVTVNGGVYSYTVDKIKPSSQDDGYRWHVGARSSKDGCDRWTERISGANFNTSADPKDDREVGFVVNYVKIGVSTPLQSERLYEEEDNMELNFTYSMTGAIPTRFGTAQNDTVVHVYRYQLDGVGAQENKQDIGTYYSATGSFTFNAPRVGTWYIAIELATNDIWGGGNVFYNILTFTRDAGKEYKVESKYIFNVSPGNPSIKFTPGIQTGSLGHPLTVAEASAQSYTFVTKNFTLGKQEGDEFHVRPFIYDYNDDYNYFRYDEEFFPPCSLPNEDYAENTTYVLTFQVYRPSGYPLMELDDETMVQTPPVYFKVGEVADMDPADAPVFDPVDGTVGYNSITVTLTCPTPDATIWYSADGLNYTKYNAGSKPKVQGTPGQTVQKTVFAYAKADGYTESDTVSVTYTIRSQINVINIATLYSDYESLAEDLATPTDDAPVYQITGDMVITHVDNNGTAALRRIYVQDYNAKGQEGQHCIIMQPVPAAVDLAALKQGDLIHHVQGKLIKQGGVLYFVPLNLPITAESHNNTIWYDNFTVEGFAAMAGNATQAAAYRSHVVTIPYVRFNTSASVFTANNDLPLVDAFDNTKSLTMRSNFNTDYMGGAVPKNVNYNLTGIVTLDNPAKLAPRNWADFVKAPYVDITTANTDMGIISEGTKDLVCNISYGKFAGKPTFELIKNPDGPAVRGFEITAQNLPDATAADEKTGTFTVTYTYQTTSGTDEVWVVANYAGLKDTIKLTAQSRPRAAAPTFSTDPADVAQNTAVDGPIKVFLSSTTTGNDIYYRRNSVATYTKYPDTGIVLNPGSSQQTHTIYAYTAEGNGFAQSTEVSAVYIIKKEMTSAAAPTFSPATGAKATYQMTVTLSSTTPNATYKYNTDGSDNYTDYPAGGIVLTNDAVDGITEYEVTVYAITVADGYLNSAPVQATYKVHPRAKIKTPEFSPESGTEAWNELEFTLSCASEGATIEYSTDGTSWTAYTAGSKVKLTSTTTVKARASKTDSITSDEATATYTITPLTDVATIEALYAYEEDCNTDKYFRITGDVTVYQADYNANDCQHPKARVIYVQDKNGAGRSGERSLVITPASADDIDISGLNRGTVVKNIIGRLRKEAQFGLISFLPEKQTLQTNGTATIWADTVDADNFYYINKPSGRKYHAGLVCVPYLQFSAGTSGNFKINTPVGMIDAKTKQSAHINLRPDFAELTTHEIPSSGRDYFVTGMIMFADNLLRIVPRDYNDIVLAPTLDITTPNQALEGIYAGNTSLEATVTYSNAGNLPFAGSAAPALSTVKNTGGFAFSALADSKFTVTYTHRGGAYKDTLWVVAKYDRLTDTLKVWAESKACNAPVVTPSTSGTNVTLNLGGTYIEYVVDYSATNGPWPTANKQTVTAKSVPYTGLNYSTTYYYYVQGVCAKNGDAVTSISSAAEGHFETGPQGGMSIALDDNKPSTEEITDGAVHVKYTYENISLGAGTAVQDGREGLVKITFYDYAAGSKGTVLGGKLTTLDAYDTTFSVSGTYYVEVKLVQLDGTDWTGEGINASDIIDGRAFTVNLPDAAAPVISVVAPEPVYVIEGGVTKYYDSVQIQITCTETGAAVLYTLNGTNWTPYSAPFYVKSSTTVEAKSVVGMKDDGYTSLPVTVLTDAVDFYIGVLPEVDRKYTTLTYNAEGGSINYNANYLRDDITITLKSKDNKPAIALTANSIARLTNTTKTSGSLPFTAAFTDKVPGYWEDTLIFTSGGKELLRKVVTTTITAFKVPEVVIAPASPTEYAKQVEVSMSLGTVVNTAATYDIYYTLNGEVPVQEETETNFKYSAPFTLLNDTVASCSYTVKALAFDHAKIDTPLVTPAAITYTLNNAALVSAGPKTASYTIYKDSAIKNNTLSGYTVKYLPAGKNLDISVSKRKKDTKVAVTVTPATVDGEGAGKPINFDLAVARHADLHDTGSFQDTVVIRLDGKVLYKTVVNLRVDYLSLPAMNPMLKGSEDVALGRVYTGTKDADITVTYRDLLDKRFDAVSGEKSDKGTVKYTLIGTDKAYFTLVTPNAEEQQYTFSNGAEETVAALVRYTYQPDHLGEHKAGLEIRHTHVTKGLMKDTVWITAESRACAAPTVEKTVDSVVFATLTLNSEDALSYTYRYGTDASALASAEEKALTGNTLELATLKAGTTYYYQIKSHCADDVTGEYFAAKNFKTKAPVLELTRPENNTVYNKAEDAEFNFYVENIHLSAAPSPLPAKYLPYGKIKVEIFKKGEGDSYTLVDEAMEVYTTSVKKFLSTGDYKVKATLITEQPATPAGLVPDIEVEQTFKVNLPNLPLVKFTPADGTVHYDSLQLNLACDSAKATIYYSLDKTSWKEYNASDKPWIKTPAGKNALVKVYAYAKQDKCDDSDVAEAEYEIRPLTKVNSAADLYAYYSELQDKEKPGFNDKYFQINGNLIVTHTDSSEAVRRRIYVQDEGGNVKEGARSLIIRILSTHKNISVKNYKRSDMLQQGIIGQMVRQDSLMRFLPIDEPIAVQSTGHDIYVDTLTLAEIKANKVKYHGDLACITYVSFNATNKEYFEPDQFYTLTCEHGETMRFRTEFKYADYLYPDPVAIPKDGAKYFITGILTQTVDGGVGRARITPRDRNDVAKAPFVDITTANTNLGYLYTGTAKVDAQFDYGNYTGELGLEFVKNTRGFALAKDIPAKTFTVTYTKQDDAGKDTAWVVATYSDRTDTLKVWAESRLCPVPVMQEPSTGPHNATLEFDGPYVRVEIDTTTVDGSWHDATKTMIVNAPNNQKSFAGLPFSTTYYYRVSGVCANEKDNTVTVNSDYAQGNFTTGDEGDMAIILDEDWPAATCEGKVHIVYDVDNIGLGADAEVEEGGNKGLVRIVIFENDEHGDTVVKVFTKEKVFDTFLLSGRYLVSVRLVDLDSNLIVLPGKENQITKRRVINVNLPDVDAPVIAAVAPFISPKPDEYYDSVTVKITCPDGEATLEYSYNGNDWESYTEPIKLKESKTVYAKSSRYRMDSSFDTLGIKIWTNPPVLHQADGKNVYTHTDFTTLSWTADSYHETYSWHETYDMTTDYLRTDMDIEVKSAEGQEAPAIMVKRSKIAKDTGYYTNWNLTVYPAEPLVGAGTYQDTIIISTQGIILDKIVVNITIHAFTAPRVVITPATNTEPGFEREVKVAMKLGTAANTAATYDIYYTLDGSVPTQEETETCFKYNDTITLVNDTVASCQYTIKALAFDRAKVDTTKETLLASATYTLWHEVEIDQEHENETFAVITENLTFTKEIKHTAKYLTGNVNVVIRKRASDEVAALEVTPKSFTGFTGTAAGDELNFTVTSVSGLTPGSYQDTVKITSSGKVLCMKVINLRVKPYLFPVVKESTHKEFYGATENITFRVAVEGIDSELETIGTDYVVVATRTPENGGSPVEEILGSTAALNFNAGVIPSGYHNITFALKRVDAEGNLFDYMGKTWAGADSAVTVLSFRIGVGIVDAPTDLVCDNTGYDEDLVEPYLTFSWTRGDNSEDRPTEVQILNGEGTVLFAQGYDDANGEPAVVYYILENLPSGTYTWRARHISDVDSSAWTEGTSFTLNIGDPAFEWYMGVEPPHSFMANKGVDFEEAFVKLKNACIGYGVYAANVQLFVSQNGEWEEIEDEHELITTADKWNYTIEGFSFPVHQLSLKHNNYPAGLYRYTITLCDAYGSNIKVNGKNVQLIYEFRLIGTAGMKLSAPLYCDQYGVAAFYGTPRFELVLTGSPVLGTEPGMYFVTASFGGTHGEYETVITSFEEGSDSVITATWPMNKMTMPRAAKSNMAEDFTNANYVEFKLWLSQGEGEEPTDVTPKAMSGAYNFRYYAEEVKPVFNLTAKTILIDEPEDGKWELLPYTLNFDWRNAYLGCNEGNLVMGMQLYSEDGSLMAEGACDDEYYAQFNVDEVDVAPGKYYMVYTAKKVVGNSEYVVWEGVEKDTAVYLIGYRPALVAPSNLRWERLSDGGVRMRWDDGVPGIYQMRFKINGYDADGGAVLADNYRDQLYDSRYDGVWQWYVRSVYATQDFFGRTTVDSASEWVAGPDFTMGKEIIGMSFADYYGYPDNDLYPNDIIDEFASSADVKFNIALDKGAEPVTDFSDYQYLVALSDLTACGWDCDDMDFYLRPAGNVLTFPESLNFEPEHAYNMIVILAEKELTEEMMADDNFDPEEYAVNNMFIDTYGDPYPVPVALQAFFTMAAEPAPEPEPVKLPSVKFEPEGGTFNDSVWVKLSHDSVSASIYYRLASDADFALYTDSLKLTELSTTVEAFAYMEGELLLNSDTLSKTFYVLKSGEENPTIKLPSVIVKPEEGEFTDSVWVELTCSDAAAEIYYRTEATAEYALYKGIFKLTDTATVQAFAHIDDEMFVNSDTVSARFNVTPWVAPVPVKLPSVKFEPDGGRFDDSVWVKLSHDSAAAKIFYRLSSDAAFALYTDSVKFTELSTTVEAFACMEDELRINSDTLSRTFYVLKSGEENPKIKLDPVTVKPDGGNFNDSVWVELSCPLPEAKIYYRLEADAEFELYEGAFKLTDTTRVEAFAHVDDTMFINSDTASVLFNVKEWVAPVPVKLPSVKFSPNGGEHYYMVWVTLSCDNTAAEIYYRLSASDAFMRYTSRFKLTESATVEAFAHIDGELFINSDTSSVLFTVKEPDPEPVKLPAVYFEPDGGEFNDSVWVSLSHDSAAAKIYYRTISLDGEAGHFIEYTTPFKLTDTMMVEAYASMEGNFINSDVEDVWFYVADTRVEPTPEPEPEPEITLESVSLYPNPTSGEFKVEVPAGSKVGVFGNQGKILYLETDVEGVRTYRLYTAGIYFVRVTVGEKSVVKRVIVR